MTSMEKISRKLVLSNEIKAATRIPRIMKIIVIPTTRITNL